MKRAFLFFVFTAVLGIFNSSGQSSDFLLGQSPTTAADSMKVTGLELNRAIVDMPVYNPNRFDAKVLVFDPSENWIYNMPVIGKKKSYSLKSRKHLLKNGPGNVNKGQKNQPAEQE